VELVHADRWIYSKLNGDAPLKALVTGGIHGFPAPIGASYPLVLYQDVTSTDIRGNGPSRIGSSGEWLIRAAFETGTFGGNLELAAERIDLLLQGQGGGEVWACVRVRPFRLVDNASSRQIRYLGGFYRLWVGAS
jgi:hypothetical protein